MAVEGCSRRCLKSYGLLDTNFCEGCGGIQTIWMGAKMRLGGNNGCGRV